MHAHVRIPGHTKHTERICGVAGVLAQSSRSRLEWRCTAGQRHLRRAAPGGARRVPAGATAPRGRPLRADKVCSSRRCSAGCVRRSEQALPAGERAPVGPEPAAASLPSLPTSAPPRPRSTDRSPPAARRRPCRWASRRPGRRARVPVPAGAAGRGPATRRAPPWCCRSAQAPDDLLQTSPPATPFSRAVPPARPARAAGRPPGGGRRHGTEGEEAKAGVAAGPGRSPRAAAERRSPIAAPGPGGPGRCRCRQSQAGPLDATPPEGEARALWPRRPAGSGPAHPRCSPPSPAPHNLPACRLAAALPIALPRSSRGSLDALCVWKHCEVLPKAAGWACAGQGPAGGLPNPAGAGQGCSEGSHGVWRMLKHLLGR